MRPKTRALVPLWRLWRLCLRGLHALTDHHEQSHPFGQMIVCRCGWIRPGSFDA